MTQRVFIVAKTIPKEVQGSIGYSLAVLDAAFSCKSRAKQYCDKKNRSGRSPYHYMIWWSARVRQKPEESRPKGPYYDQCTQSPPAMIWNLNPCNP